MTIFKITCIALVHPGALGVQPRVLREEFSCCNSASENAGGGAGCA